MSHSHFARGRDETQEPRFSVIMEAIVQPASATSAECGLILVKPPKTGTAFKIAIWFIF
ncbi:hypothetical protein HMPREF0577_0582 [Mobiluncus mulieris ATCC 35243]|nr:hypothetical protein HMPREF0577_0582 [Mobiluncus mulieris ATCC 35243]